MLNKFDPEIERERTKNMQNTGPGILCILYSYWQLSWKYEIHKSRTAVNVEKKKCSEIPNHGVEFSWNLVQSSMFFPTNCVFMFLKGTKISSCHGSTSFLPFFMVFFHHLMIQRIESEGTLWERLFWHEAQTCSFSVRHVVLMRECAWNRFLVFTVTIQCRRF